MLCGIDVSKNKSNVCILDKDLKVIKEFEIEHDKAGFEKLDKYLTPETKIAMEVTGNYSKIVYNHLKDKYDVCYVDGVQMQNIARFQSPTIKNDKVDAKLLAKALTFPDLIKVNPIKMNELKDLCNLYQKITKQLSRHKSMFKDQINIIFPELEKMMSNNNNVGLANMLLEYSTPEEIGSKSNEGIQKALKKNMGKGSGKFTLEYAQKIRDFAKDSVGDSSYPTLYFKHTIKTMLYYRELKKELKQNLNDTLMKTPYHPLLDEFGFNTASVATIVGEIGDIRKFSNFKKFASYCGFGIYEKTSGTSINKSSRLSKRGNSRLRHTFYMLVLVHLSYKTDISKYYKKLKERGKHPKKCIIAAARKLAVRTYFEMLKCHKQEELQNNNTYKPATT